MEEEEEGADAVSRGAGGSGGRWWRRHEVGEAGSEEAEAGGRKESVICDLDVRKGW